MEIQKSAKLASQGLYREAQAQAHITRKYLSKNKRSNENNNESYKMFNNNMNHFNQNLGRLHIKNEKNPNINKDVISEQIYSLEHTSKNRQKNMYKRSKK